MRPSLVTDEVIALMVRCLVLTIGNKLGEEEGLLHGINEGTNDVI